MNLVVTPSKIEDIEQMVNNGADIFVVGNDLFSTRMPAYFTLSEIKGINKLIKSLDKKIYISLNLMCHNKVLDDVFDFILFIKELNVDGIIFSDTAIYNLCKEVGLENLLIYNPSTLNTNKFDPIFWSALNIKGITISKEISLDNIIEIAKDSPIEISLIGHGFLNMFHSYRPLIENFFKYLEEDFVEYIDNKNMYLIEEIRNEKYPVIQDIHGTHIFREKELNSLREIINLKGCVDDFIIDGIFKNVREYLELIKVYKSILKKENTDGIDKCLEKYKNKYNSGFYYKKTTYKK